MTAPTRDRIVDAAAELFRHQGLHATGVKQIVGLADAQLASLYHFFPGGKEELADAVVRTAGAGYQELVTAVWDAEADVVASVRAVFVGAAEVLEATGYEDACPIATVALEVASTNETLRVATADVFAQWHDAATNRLERAGIAGDVARRLAFAIVAAVEGGFVLARAARSPEPMLAAGEIVTAAVAGAIPPAQ